MRVALQVGEQVEHLGLHALVQCADRLVADDQLGFGGQCPGDGGALQLPAGELVRVAARMGRVEADAVEQFRDPIAGQAVRPQLNSSDAWIVSRGLRLVCGFCGTTCIRRRNSRSRRPRSRATSAPSK